jgi:hypothetical protein
MWRGAGGGSSVTGASIATALGGEDTVTAFATGGQGSATALSSTVYNHRVTVCATAGDSVKLPAATVGQDHYVRNDGAASMQVYGQATETIDGVASATGVAQAAGTGVFYVCTTAGKWTRASQLNNPTITGTVSAPQVTGIEIIVAHTAIPFIHISSGSIAANGAISGITALPSAYPRAYCYFPRMRWRPRFRPVGTTAPSAPQRREWRSSILHLRRADDPVEPHGGHGRKGGIHRGHHGAGRNYADRPRRSDGAERRTHHLSALCWHEQRQREDRASALGWGCGHDVDLDHMASNLGLDTRTEIANNGNAAVQTGTSMRISSGSSATQATNYATVNSAVATTVVLSPSKGTATDNIVTEKVSVAVRYGQ